MLHAQFFHINNVEKLPKLHEQLNAFLAQLEPSDIVDMKTTEVGASGHMAFYSYTILLLYKRPTPVSNGSLVPGQT